MVIGVVIFYLLVKGCGVVKDGCAGRGAGGLVRAAIFSGGVNHVPLPDGTYDPWVSLFDVVRVDLR